MQIYMKQELIIKLKILLSISRMTFHDSTQGWGGDKNVFAHQMTGMATFLGVSSYHLFRTQKNSDTEPKNC